MCEKQSNFRGGRDKLEENIRDSIDNLETVPMKAVEQKKDPLKTVRGNLINGNHEEREKRPRRYSNFTR